MADPEAFGATQPLDEAIMGAESMGATEYWRDLGGALLDVVKPALVITGAVVAAASFNALKGSTATEERDAKEDSAPKSGHDLGGEHMRGSSGQQTTDPLRKG